MLALEAGTLSLKDVDICLLSKFFFSVKVDFESLKDLYTNYARSILSTDFDVWQHEYESSYGNRISTAKPAMPSIKDIGDNGTGAPTQRCLSSQSKFLTIHRSLSFPTQFQQELLAR